MSGLDALLTALLPVTRAIDAVTTWLGKRIAWLILAAVLVSAANATVRKIFDTSSNSWLELQWVLFSMVFLLCSPWTLLANEHIRIDIVNNLLPKNVRNSIDVIGHAFFLLPLCLIMTITGIPFFYRSLAITALLAIANSGHGETGAEGWLRYSPLPASALQQYAQMPHQIVSLDDSAISKTATAELQRGIHRMLGYDLISTQGTAGNDAIVIGTVDQVRAALAGWTSPPDIKDGGFALHFLRSGAHNYWIIAGKDSRGELYGVFHLLEQIAQLHSFADDTESPSAPDSLGESVGQPRWVD